jgi:cytoskeleton protein RodZ
MSEALIENPSVETPAYAPLGEVLSAARKAKKLTEQDVSNNLRLSIKQIIDIENNQFSTLPQPMITRGFIRNYARLLELDAEPLLDSYRARVPDKAPKSVSVQSSMYEVVSGKEGQPWLKYILGSILVLLFLLSWVFYIDYMPKQAKPAAEKTTETVVSAPQPTEITLPEVALPAAERQAEAEAAASGTPADSAVAPANSASSQTVPAAGAVTVTPAANINSINTNTTNATSATAVNTEAAKVQSNQAAAIASKPSSAVDFNTLKEKAAQNAQATNVVAGSSAIKPVAPATPVATTAPVATAEQTPAQKVSFSITEKTWIQATDKSGKVVFERILQAGSTDGFDGQPPFNVVIGNAKATKLSYLGKPVDLAPSTTQNNVARIKLE